MFDDYTTLDCFDAPAFVQPLLHDDPMAYACVADCEAPLFDVGASNAGVGFANLDAARAMSDARAIEDARQLAGFEGVVRDGWVYPTEAEFAHMSFDQQIAYFVAQEAQRTRLQ